MQKKLKFPKPIAKPMTFPVAIHSFMGYLEGTQKSAHTIKSYRLDLSAFQKFLLKQAPDKAIKLQEVSREDLKRFQDFLVQQGLKTNTRRRKILTITQFLNYLAKRNKAAPELAEKIVTPHKIERIPFTLSQVQLHSVKSAIQKWPLGTLLESRNRALLWTLVETGCLVSEVVRLRFDQWTPSVLHLGSDSRASRSIPISLDLYEAIQELKRQSKDCPWIFLGFNKFGSLGSPITPRGVEMLVKFYGPQLGFPMLTPRTIRHSTVIDWFRQGIPQSEIQTRLGLKTTYAFRAYEAILKSNFETTSTREMNQPEFVTPQE